MPEPTPWDAEDSVCAYPAYCFCCDTALAYRLGVDPALVSKRWADHLLQTVNRPLAAV